MQLPTKIIIIILIFFKSVFSFELNNLFGDVISNGNSKSYFGYTVQLIKSSVGNNYRLLVGAPLDTNQNDTGGLYSCSVNDESNCSRYLLDLKTSGDLQKIGNGLDHHHKRDGQWLGGSLDVSDTGFVVCAPRWINKIFAQRYYFVNGLCYWMPNNIDNTNKLAYPLKPLLLNTRQGFNHNNTAYYYYAYGQAGISAHVVTNKEKIEILLGAPGIIKWKGSVIRYINNNLNHPIIPNPINENKIDFFSYFGYSISSGFFSSNGLLSYVAGAPRGANLLGQIFVFNYNIHNEFQIIYHANGTELGEYFGAAVTVTDFNGDGFDDIFVGSPTYSSRARDAGRVHFLQSNGKGDFKRIVLDEPNKAKARFGTTLSAIGDINLDGCNDVAIGAPYWGQNGEGAIFIYYGSKIDLYSYNYQIILGSDINPLLRGFGISISKGLDIDNNGINDIAVGAYGNNQVVIIKQRPIINVILSTKSSVKIIPYNNTDDFTIFGCLNYTGKNVPRKVKFLLKMNHDPDLRRVSQSEIFNLIEANINEEYCYNFTITLKSREDEEDRIYTEPLEFRFSYEIFKTEDCKSNNKTWCPVSENVKSETVIYIPFETGCGNSSSCLSDLKLKMKWNRDLEKFIVGSSNGLELLFDIQNTGEPAFITKLSVYSSVPLLSMPGNCEEVNFGFINCRIGNPFETKKTLKLILDTYKIKLNTKNIFVNASISSIGLDNDPADNFMKLELPVSVESYIDFHSLSEPEQFSFGETEIDIEIINETIIVPQEQNITKELTVVHQIEAINKGPSPLDNVRMDIFVPYKLDGNEFLTIQDVQAKSNQAIDCVMVFPENYTEPLPASLHGDDIILSVLPKNRTYNLACNADHSYECIRIICHTSNSSVENMNQIVIKLEMILDLQLLDENRNFKDLLVFTTSSLITSEQILGNKYHHVSTVLIGTFKSINVVFWIIIGVVCGIFLLCITIGIFYKLGFFKRKKLDSESRALEMNNIMEEEEDHDDEKE